VFQPAQARIQGETVVLAAAGVAAPETVRYAWRDDPDGNLANGAGLPASPFRREAR
jgi:sialate O-acetylesterase